MENNHFLSPIGWQCPGQRQAPELVGPWEPGQQVLGSQNYIPGILGP